MRGTGLRGQRTRERRLGPCNLGVEAFRNGGVTCEGIIVRSILRTTCCITVNSRYETKQQLEVCWVI